jgi:hypothetical protein
MKNTVDNQKEEQNKQEDVNTLQERLRTSTKPDHNLATARIFIYGLSILWLNHRNKTVEIGFVKDEHSPVTLKVCKQDDCKDCWIYKPKDRKVRIEINKTIPSGMGEFYEDDRANSEDFEWMPDLKGRFWHKGANIQTKGGAEHYLSAKLVLKDAVFYTHLRSVSDAEQRGRGSSLRILSDIGRVLGADIICDENDAGIEVKVIGKKATGDEEIIEQKSFAKGDGPFTISLITEPESNHDHLHLLYDQILDVPATEPKYRLKYKEEEDPFKHCDNVGRATEYACQAFVDGSNPPDFPPS